MTLRPFFLLALVVVGLTAAETRDVINLKNNTQKWAIVDSELVDKMIFRVSAAPTSKPSEQSYREVKFGDVGPVQYFEMKEGHWPLGIEALNAGKYAEAADRFNAVATTGTREWQKVYGAFYEGSCYDLLGDYPKAAEAFARAASVNPLHRLALDAQYRQGFALARAKKDADAQKVVEALADLAKKDHNSAADLRANAIRAVLAFNAGDGDQLKKCGGLARFDMKESPVAYIQFGTFFADALLKLKLTREAEAAYKNMLSTPELGPSEKLPLQLGYARVIMETDAPSALVELLRIDALPYGSIDAKCQVRYLAGKILAAEVKAGRANPPASQEAKDWLAGQESTARLLLSAASASSSDVPEKQAAGLELSALDPEPAKDDKGTTKPADAAPAAPAVKKPGAP